MERSITVVIPTYERPHAPGQVIKSLQGQCESHDSLVVVWQGATAPVLGSSGSPDVRLVHLRAPNLPRARNAAIPYCKGDILLYLDDDTVPQPGLLDAHRRAYDDQGVGAVAGRIEDAIFDRTLFRTANLDIRTGEYLQNYSIDKGYESIAMMGANMSIRRDVLQEVHGFDPNYSRNALWEEVDCAFRIRLAGYHIRYCPEARVVHQRASSGGCRSDAAYRYVFNQFANTAYFACKFVPRTYWKSWIHFWKYRLEYFSRSGRLGTCGKHAHDLPTVAAGCAGACIGALRYFVRCHRSMQAAGSIEDFNAKVYAQQDRDMATEKSDEGG